MQILHGQCPRQAKPDFMFHINFLRWVNKGKKSSLDKLEHIDVHKGGIKDIVLCYKILFVVKRSCFDQWSTAHKDDKE